MAGRLLIGDCRESLRTLPAKSVHCCVTSPPYYALRDYGVAGQLGLEKSPADYIAAMVSVFAEVWRVLRDDGVCWINIGDSYAGAGKTGGGAQGAHERHSCESLSNAYSSKPRPPQGLKEKDLVGIPWRLAFALQDAGWYLRQDCIWHKPNPMPESVRDRCTKAHEYVFLLTKSARYFFDGDAIKTKTSAKTLTVKTTPRKGTGLESTGEKINAWMEGNGGRYHPEESNRRSVWTIATHSYRGAHFATYPPKLVEPCILAGTSARGCCPTCGAPWRRVVESQRVATRPGTGSKVTGDTLTDGNRDPQRHVAIKKTTGWQQTCKCRGYNATGPAIEWMQQQANVAELRDSCHAEQVLCDLRYGNGCQAESHGENAVLLSGVCQNWMERQEPVPPDAIQKGSTPSAFQGTADGQTRLHSDLLTESSKGRASESCSGASTRNGAGSGAIPDRRGSCSSHQRCEERQPTGEPCGDAQTGTSPGTRPGSDQGPSKGTRSRSFAANKSLKIPEQLAAYIVEVDLSPRPCTVLDPFMGSGTTAIVAEHHGREWIGCELSEAYAELARQRIAEGWHPKPEKRKRLKLAGRGMRQLLLMGE